MVSAFAAVTPSLAQGTPTGGLFGATRSDTADRTRLNLTVMLSEAFDSELPPEFRTALPQNSRQTGGYSTMLVGQADYAYTRRRARIAGTAETAFRYDQRINLVDPVSHSVGLGANIRLPGTASFQVDQTAAYSPSYLYQLFPPSAAPTLGEAIPTAPDYRAAQIDSYSYRSSMTLAIGSPRGTRVSASGDYDRTELRNQPALQPSLKGYGARGKVARGVRRNIELSVEYVYRTAEFGLGGGVSTEHRFALGAGYSRALSTSRRASFHVNVAPSTLQMPESAINLVGARRLYQAQGDASVEYQFRRNWQASGSVQRHVEYIAVLADPVFSDAARLAVQGLFTRRIDMIATAGYATGSSAINRGSQLDSYTGNVRVRFAFKRSLVFYTEYLYYYFDLRRYQHRLADLPAVFDQQGVRVGLMVWASPF